MTAIELASKLDGIEYDKLVNFNSEVKEIFNQAKESGLAVVFGASDDLMEFRGAIDDEEDCYGGGTVYLSKNEIDHDYGANKGPYNNRIVARWCAGDVAWTYKTDIPHETFNVMEDGEIYCIGIVFRMEDLK